ncbi:MAG: flagellar biosynthetic protein FliR [Steroidobacteraceae bacterium]|jgi:flagellar biosynthetic protein FliR|nr:flagellar biosynthetic protein FliR [Steroidobacteraceae bacterium]
MEFGAAQITGWVTALLWPLLRISGLMLLAPVLGANVVPARLRMVLALALAVLVSPLAPPPPAFDPLSAEGVLAMAMQIAIGAAIGFAVQIAFDALVMAGQLVAMTMGLGFATLVDPARGGATPVLSQFLLILGILLFLSVDGHLALIGVLVDSFRWAPVGPAGLGPEGLWSLVLWGGKVFEAGLVIALPALIALLGVNLGMGVVSRAAPQLNLFAVGFPVAMLFGFLVLLISLPALQGVFLGLLEGAFSVAAGVGGGG